MSDSRVFIDLTGDDSDTSGVEIVPASRLQPHSTDDLTHSFTFGQRATSNHALPIISDFPSEESRISNGFQHANDLLDNHQPASVNSSSALQVGSALRQDSTMSRREAVVSRKPTVQSLPSTAENLEPETNARRSTHANGRNKRQKTKHIGDLPTAPQQLQNQLQESRHTRNPHLLGKTIITGATRAADSQSVSRVSTDGKVQKLKAVKRKGCDERTTEVIKRQVIPHILEAVLPYRPELSKTDRKEFADKIASDLVCDPGFLENLVSNNYQLPPDYENSIAMKAKSHAARYFEELKQKQLGSPITKASTAQNRCLKPEPALDTSLNIFDDTFSYDWMTSEASTDAEEVFESHSAPNYRHSSSSIPSRGQSFSPATSFSNDAVDPRSPPKGDIDHDEMYGASRSIRTLPKRTSRALQPIYARPKLTRAKRKTPNQNEINQIGVPSSNIKLAEDAKQQEQAPQADALQREHLELRGYFSFSERLDIERRLSIGPPSLNRRRNGVLRKIQSMHVLFSTEEIEMLCQIICKNSGSSDLLYLHPLARVESLMLRRENSILNIEAKLIQEAETLPPSVAALFENRDLEAILAFLEDVTSGKTEECLPPFGLLTIEIPAIAEGAIEALLRQREINGLTPVRARSGQNSFKAAVSNYFEDCFERQSEWTNCSGTILTLTWTSPDAFICGAVAHSDCNHMQYNKPGNLLLGSISQDTLRAYPDHRLIRPVVSATENASNAQEAMRQTQDPWMYLPVVTTAHSEMSGYTFTASFDKTVKVWTLKADGSSMDLKGTWLHEHRVNFVAASQYHDRVATASESMSNAVRVYHLDEDAISDSSYDQYCGNKASVQAEEIRRREKWAYYPSTIQWGRAERVKYLLLVGWSPRSDSGDDTDIPEDKRNTGELCLWNSIDSSRVPINSAHFQNVFEVIWHPTQPFFLAATSPSGNFDADTTKTQIRLFGLNANGSFINNRTFDCPACDVNELTLMPTSGEECFVTASCTDRCTYVYDSKMGDQPIHVLQHQESLDEPGNEDSGVKFASWGSSSDRFYTGSSDGVLKVWDIKAPPGKAFLRDVLKFAGGIYVGAFSKDFSKLLIGDDTGKVHFLTVNENYLSLDQTSRSRYEAGIPCRLAESTNGLLSGSIKRPKLIIPHPDPPNPNNIDATQQCVGKTSAEIALQFLEEGHLRLFPNRDFPSASRAVFQGPNYNETLLYRFEAHEDSDATKSLKPEFLSKQQFQADLDQQRLSEEAQQWEENKTCQRILRMPPSVVESLQRHQMNLGLDLNFENLSLSTKESLLQDRVEYEGDFIFDYELMPSKKHPFLGD